MENKSNKKTPTIQTWIAFGFFLVMLFVLFNTIASEIKQDSSVKQINKEEKEREMKAQAQDFWDKGENLNKEVGDIFVAPDTIFSKSHLENIANTSIHLELTVNDDWYYLPKFKQEMLIEDTCRTFDALTVKHGLRKEDDMPWKVIFLDTYGKEVAKDKCW